MTLRAVERRDLASVLEWRRGLDHTLRTPFELNMEQQEQWYRDVVCDRRANSRYWMIETAPLGSVGQCGLENIEWTNGRGEIALLLAPNQRGRGLGHDALGLLLEQGFGALGLESIWGECYECSPALGFWEREAKERGAETARLPRMKRWRGSLYGAFHFTFSP